jgi:hypothetical protein
VAAVRVSCAELAFGDAVHGVRSPARELLREIEEGDRLACRHESSVAVLGSGAELGAREGRRGLDELGDEELHRASRAVERARTAGAVADDRHVRIALVEADAVDRDS